MATFGAWPLRKHSSSHLHRSCGGTLPFVLRAGDGHLACSRSTMPWAAVEETPWPRSSGLVRSEYAGRRPLHAARPHQRDAAAVIERKVQNGRRYVYLGPRLDAPPMDVSKGPSVDEPGVKAVESPKGPRLAHFLRATAGAGALPRPARRRAPEIRHLRRWLGPIIQESIFPASGCGWFAASSAGCLFSSQRVSLLPLQRGRHRIMTGQGSLACRQCGSTCPHNVMEPVLRMYQVS